MGYHDASALYAFAAGDPVNGRDPSGNVCLNPFNKQCRQEMAIAAAKVEHAVETATIYANELNDAAAKTFMQFNVGVVEGAINTATFGQYNGVKQAIKEGKIRVPHSLKEAGEVAENIQDAQLHGVGQFVTLGTLDTSMKVLEAGGTPVDAAREALKERIGWTDMDNGMKKMLNGDPSGLGDFSGGVSRLAGTAAFVLAVTSPRPQLPEPPPSDPQPLPPPVHPVAAPPPPPAMEPLGVPEPTPEPTPEPPRYIYRTGSQTTEALTDESGVSFREHVSSAADGTQTFKHGENIYAADTTKLPSGSAVVDGGVNGNPPGHVSVKATPEQIKAAIVERGPDNPLDGLGLKDAANTSSYKLPKAPKPPKGPTE
jgi:hypothetical protein